MKRRIKQKNKQNKIVARAIIAVVVIFFVSAIFFVPNKTRAVVSGWGTGIWNNFVAGHPENDPSLKPSIGWLSSNSDLSGCNGALSKKYSVNLKGAIGDAERPVVGQAWFGIGSQPDSGGTCDNPPDLPSLGWLNFEAGAPSFCSGGDCHQAQWHSTGSDHTGYLDGWAQVTSMGDNGWVRLKGANYSVTSNDVSGKAVLSGFGWNSGNNGAADADPNLVKNTGLGWIRFDGLELAECNLGCATKSLCRTGAGSSFSSCDSSFCTGGGTSCTLGSDNISWSCTNSCTTKPCGGQQKISWIDTEAGACGPLDGKSICDPNQTPTDENLCANNTTPHNYTSNALTATWTCGGNQCGGSVSPQCSASTRCGWIETAP